jgi:hypothetical protein
MLVWCAIGLTGEAGELLECRICDREHECMAKELGDVLWYLAALFSTISKPLPFMHPIQNNTGLTAVSSLILAASKVADEIKKQVFHDHGRDDEEVYALLCDCCDAIGFVLWEHSMSVEAVMRLNIEKIDARFPEGFNSKDSISRKVLQPKA